MKEKEIQDKLLQLLKDLQSLDEKLLATCREHQSEEFTEIMGNRTSLNALIIKLCKEHEKELLTLRPEIYEQTRKLARIDSELIARLELEARKLQGRYRLFGNRVKI